MRRPEVIPGYTLSAPTESDVLKSLGEVLGEHAERTWNSVCVRARVQRSADMSSVDIAKAAQFLLPQGGAVAIRARSIIVRAHAYVALSASRK